MKNILFITLAVLAFVSSASATVTIQIRAILANSAGVATNGMSWGILVDSTGNGFGVTPTGSINTFDFASDGLLGDDNYYAGGSTVFFAPAGGAGVATQLDPITLSGDVGTGDAFGIFWTDGTKYGFVTETGAVIPTDPSTTSFQSVFSNDPYTAAGTIVPEPSTYAMFAGALALGYVMIRRRR